MQVPYRLLISVGFSAPFIGRILGHVGVLGTDASGSRPLAHLPPALARMVHEAVAIRQELPQGLEPAMERAWRLIREFASLPAEQRAGRDHSQAAIAAIQALLDLHTGHTGVAHELQRERLAAALDEFADSLAEPTSAGFR